MSNNYKIKDETLRGIWSSLKTQATKCGVETDNIKVEDYHTLIDNLNVSEYTDYDGESPVYEQSVPPTSRPIAKVKMVGGKSRKVVQLLNKENYQSTQTINGITFTNNNDGSYTASGTSTGEVWFYFNENESFKVLNLKQIHKYIALGYSKDKEVTFRDAWSGVLGNDGASIFEYNSETMVYSLHIDNNKTINNAVAKPLLFDLTEMYGAGNEPTTVEQFKKDFPNEYYGYTEGEIKHAQVDKLVSESANRWTNGDITLKGNSLYSISLKAGEYTMSAFVTNDNDADTTCLCIINDIGYQFPKNKSNTINLVLDKDISAIRLYSSSNYNQSLSRTATWSNIKIYKAPYFNIEKQIPTSVIAKCTDYGVGINDTCYNYIDFVNKKYHRKVASVDLGNLDWYVAGEGPNCYYSSNFSAGNVATLIAKYQKTTTSLVGSTDKSYSVPYSSTFALLIIHDSAYTDATAFKTAMSGQILYYELATEEIIDLSDVLDDNFYRIKVEEGGTLTFHHPEADNGYIIKVPNQVTYKVNLDEIEASLTSEYANSLTEVI